MSNGRWLKSGMAFGGAKDVGIAGLFDHVLAQDPPNPVVIGGIGSLPTVKQHNGWYGVVFCPALRAPHGRAKARQDKNIRGGAGKFTRHAKVKRKPAVFPKRDAKCRQGTAAKGGALSRPNVLGFVEVRTDNMGCSANRFGMFRDKAKSRPTVRGDKVGQQRHLHRTLYPKMLMLLTTQS